MSRAPCPAWDPEFPARSPLFDPLQPVAARHFRALDDWPSLEEYQRLLDSLHRPLRVGAGQKLRIVTQDTRPARFDAHYAPRIYLSGELQTRERNWHDLFQLLTWVLFPQAKAAINARHIPPARQRLSGASDKGRRSPLENMLSLFDEGGAVVLSSDPTLLQLIREMRWKTLFWDRRDDCRTALRCLVFGHGLYEKALSPYLGMTANALLLQVDGPFIDRSLAEQIEVLDARLATCFSDPAGPSRPADLFPFPLLGLPGLDPTNEQASYYDNIDYFRPIRTRQARAGTDRQASP